MFFMVSSVKAAQKAVWVAVCCFTSIKSHGGKLPPGRPVRHGDGPRSYHRERIKNACSKVMEEIGGKE